MYFLNVFTDSVVRSDNGRSFQFRGAAYCNDLQLKSSHVKIFCLSFEKLCGPFSTDNNVDFNPSKRKMIVFNGSADFELLMMVFVFKRRN